MPEILVSHAQALVTSESGETAKFVVTLSANPKRKVVIGVRSTDLSEGMVQPSELIFDENNWFLPVAVTVTGLSDGIVDGDIAYTIELSEKSGALRWPYFELEEVDVLNLDIDIDIDIEGASFVLSTTQLETREDGKAVDFSLALGAKPSADVVVAMAVSDDSEGSLSPNELIFNASNWAQAQVVALTPLPDGIVDGDQHYIIDFAVSSSDERYDGVEITPIDVKNVDVDQATETVSFVLSTTQLETREDGKAVDFSLALGAEPSADVVVAMAVSDDSEGSLSPNELIFNASNWAQAQAVTLTPLPDGIVDGFQDYLIDFAVSSSDERYHEVGITPIEVRNFDVDYDPNTSLKIRAMAANITSGRYQSYDEGHGIRIFQALKPDIVMIQEFSMRNGTLRAMVDEAFGPEFYYTIGEGTMPNGVVSRFPIIEQGAWKSNITTNRDWDWAIIDIPGPKDLLVVSLHLKTDMHNQEMEPLKAQIDAKLAEGDYYLLMGGDFNTKTRSNIERVFSPILDADGNYPVDQDLIAGTNASRKSPYDWVLAGHEWSKFEVPVEIGSRNYPNGHVFDSRVYAKYNELSEVPPVEANDSGSSSMQHMAVIRDFLFRFDEGK